MQAGQLSQLFCVRRLADFIISICGLRFLVHTTDLQGARRAECAAFRRRRLLDMRSGLGQHLINLTPSGGIQFPVDAYILSQLG